MTIYALSSGPGISGIAVIRVSGKNTSEVIKRLPHLPIVMDKANEALTIIAEGKLSPNSASYYSLKEEELKIKLFRNNLIFAFLILVIFLS